MNKLQNTDTREKQFLEELKQNGNQRAEYGKHIIQLASQTLTAEFGKGFSERNLWKFRQFYLLFNDLQILPTLSAEFGSHKTLLEKSEEKGRR